MKSLVFLYCLGTALAHFQKNFVENHSKNGPGADKAEARITGGEEVESISDYPFVVEVGTFSEIFKCAGAIISENYVLTAASCTNLKYLDDNKVRAGTLVFTEGILIPIQKVVRHPNFNGMSDYNIAYMKTEMPIDFNDDIQPIALGTDNFSQVVMFGFGQTNYKRPPRKTFLKKVDLDVVDISTCRSLYSYLFYPSDTTFCAEDSNKGRAAGCDGDQGGPAVSDTGLVGLFTYTPYCNGELPSVFTDLNYPEIRSFIIEGTDVE